jgi:hypothetical protein
MNEIVKRFPNALSLVNLVDTVFGLRARIDARAKACSAAATAKERDPPVMPLIHASTPPRLRRLDRFRSGIGEIVGRRALAFARTPRRERRFSSPRASPRHTCRLPASPRAPGTCRQRGNGIDAGDAVRALPTAAILSDRNFVCSALISAGVMSAGRLGDRRRRRQACASSA